MANFGEFQQIMANFPNFAKWRWIEKIFFLLSSLASEKSRGRVKLGLVKISGKGHIMANNGKFAKFCQNGDGLKSPRKDFLPAVIISVREEQR